jgi:hypothetical protein
MFGIPVSSSQVFLIILVTSHPMPSKLKLGVPQFPGQRDLAVKRGIVHIRLDEKDRTRLLL